jgi:hypothetical protein
MTISTRLVSAAKIATAALALAVMVVTPATPPVLAADDSSFPPPSTSNVPSGSMPHPDPAVRINGVNFGDSRGHRRLWYSILNEGQAPTAQIRIYGYCNYATPGFASHEVSQPVVVLQPLGPGGYQGSLEVDCPPEYGRIAIAQRVKIVSDGDVNLSNNELRSGY